MAQGWLLSSSPGDLDPGRSRVLLSPVWFSRRLEQRMEEGGGRLVFVVVSFIQIV